MSSLSNTRRSTPGCLRLSLFSGVVILVAALGSIVWLSQRMAHGYLRPARQLPTETPADYGIDYQEVTLITGDGVSLAGWYTPPDNGVVILAAHGHAAARLADMHALFASNGYGVLSWDARAHGASGGEFSSLGYYERLDATAALDYVQDQPGVVHVGMWGQSMGAATAILAAAELPAIEAVIADSAYTTLAETINTAVPVALFRPFIRPFAEAEAGVSVDLVRPLDAITRLAPRPVFVIHNERDTVVPLDSGQRLFDAAGEPKSYWMIPGAGHVQGRLLVPVEYETRLLAFLAGAFPP